MLCGKLVEKRCCFLGGDDGIVMIAMTLMRRRRIKKVRVSFQFYESCVKLQIFSYFSNYIFGVSNSFIHR